MAYSFQVYNKKEKRWATCEEMERLFINPYTTGRFFWICHKDSHYLNPTDFEITSVTDKETKDAI